MIFPNHVKASNMNILQDDCRSAQANVVQRPRYVTGKSGVILLPLQACPAVWLAGHSGHFQITVFVQSTECPVRPAPLRVSQARIAHSKVASSKIVMQLPAAAADHIIQVLARQQSHVFCLRKGVRHNDQLDLSSKMHGAAWCVPRASLHQAWLSMITWWILWSIS